jgi:Predicted integral membrane protein (DUF2269)
MLAWEGNFSGAFKVFLVLHVLSAIVGLGAVMLNGLYAAQGQKRPGPGGRAISEANLAVSNIAEKVIYLIPVFGILLVATSDSFFKFSDTFVWLSLALFIGALGVSHSVLFPGHKRINALLLEMEQGPPPAGGPPPQLAQVQALGKRQAAAGASLNVVVAVILVLMVWQPR